jgi:hypothetical protein
MRKTRENNRDPSCYKPHVAPPSHFSVITATTMLATIVHTITLECHQPIYQHPLRKIMKLMPDSL